jgi:hypothetical protein
MPPRRDSGLQIPPARNLSLQAHLVKRTWGQWLPPRPVTPILRLQSMLGLLYSVHLLNWREGAQQLPVTHCGPQESDSRCPRRAHLDSPAPPPRRLSSAGVTSGNSESPASSPSSLQVWAPGFPRRTQWTRRPSGGGWGPGAGEAGRGAYLVHGERHADSVLLEQHVPAGRRPRERRGRPNR